MISERGKGKVILITGASRGIGRATAERLAAEGYYVIATDLERQSADMNDMKKTVANAGGKLDILYGDVSDAAAMDSLVAKALEMSGGIDILINNAGVLKLNLVEDISPDEWDFIYDVNAKGTFIMTKAILPHFREKQAGRIINIASIGGKLGAPLQSHYCSAKAAVIRFTQIIAQEVAKDGITINAVCPGIIDTEMGRNNYRDESALQKVKDKTALGRLGYPSDVVGSVAFFASDDASFITGQALNVCGGIVFH